MALITRFDDLPDLVLIELFSYLSSIDILWGFTHLNYRLTTLINERGFFYYINLSSARYHQFNAILQYLPLNDIQSLTIDKDASPLQLIRWPYLSRLRTLRVIGAYNHDHLSLFLLLHASTLTHLILKSNERLIPVGFSIEFYYTIGAIAQLIATILFTRLPALRSLDLGMNYYGTNWPINTAVTPLTYLRLDLPCMDTLLRLISTTPLSDTLCQFHVRIGHSRSPVSISNLSIRMNSLHTFTFVQTFFSTLTIEWTIFEMLTSSNVMPVLRRANVSIFIDISDLNRIGSSPLFTDYRHVDVHFAINLINCPQYINVTQYINMKQYIPRGNRFHPREIVNVTFLVKHVSDRLEWLTDGDPFNRGSQYHHHMWYTLPWGFDEFFYEYLPEKWIIKVHVVEKPEKVTRIGQSSLRTFDASSEMWPFPICSLPHVVLSDCIETLNLSYYNTPIPINFLSTLRNITLANSINCLNDCCLLPITIRSIRILLFYTHPNYMLPNWPVVFDSLSKLSELTSLRIFMYDLPKTIDDRNCQTIAKAATLFSDFGFYFRYKFDISDGSEFETIFNDHAKFITQLCHCILSLCLDKQPYYSFDNEHCGLTTWF